MRGVLDLADDGRGESNFPPRVRLRSSLSAGVEIIRTSIIQVVVSVRLRSPALVSKLVSELSVGLHLQTNARLKRQVYCLKLHALGAVIAISRGRQRRPGVPTLWFHVDIDEPHAPACADPTRGSEM